MKINPLLKRIRAMQLWRRGQWWNYRVVFVGEEPSIAQLSVIADLRKFCFAEHRTANAKNNMGVVDTHAMALAEGRREVWLHISRYLNLTNDQLARIEQQEIDQRTNVEREVENEYAA